MVLHTGPGDQLSGTAEPNQPIGKRGRRGRCAVVLKGVGRGGGAVLSRPSSHSPTKGVPSGLSAKSISWMSRGRRGGLVEVSKKGEGKIETVWRKVKELRVSVTSRMDGKKASRRGKKQRKRD